MCLSRTVVKGADTILVITVVWVDALPLIELNLKRKGVGS